VDSQEVLSQGTVEDVRAEVKTRLNDLKPHGGYILSPSHNIQSGVGIDRILALYETAHEYGEY
jgi:uroporphyrinogen decarboxylase